MWNSGIIASKHRLELEDYLNFSEVNEDYVDTGFSHSYGTGFEVEFKGVIDGTSEFICTNRDNLSGFDFYIDTNGDVSILIYGKATINLGNINLDTGFRTFKFKVAGTFPISAEFYVNDVITLNGSAFTSPVDSTTNFYLNTVLNQLGTPTDFYNSKVVWLRINGETYPFDEGSGFSVQSNNGTNGTGVTSNPLQVTYWNDSVWKKKSVGDDSQTVEPNYVGNIWGYIGQSNADGADVVANADPTYTGVIPNSFVWNEFTSQWDALEAGVNGSVGLKYNWLFPLAYKLNQNDPTTPNYFVTKTYGGTGMWNNWGVGLNYYNAFLNAFANANQTALYNKKAILWQQGEEDSKLLVNANNYEQDEADMIDGMKNSTGI